MGLFGRKKDEEVLPVNKMKPTRPTPRNGTVRKPMRSKSSDDIDFSGFTGIRKPLKKSGSFSKPGLKRTKSGSKTVASAKSTKSTPVKPSLETLMKMQSETNKALQNKKPSSYNSDLESSRDSRGGKKRPLKGASRGRSKSPGPRGRSKSPGRNAGRSKSPGRMAGKSAPNRSRSLGRLKASKSENLSGMARGLKSKKSSDLDSSSEHFKTSNNRGASKLAQMSKSKKDTDDKASTLKKENQELSSKKRQLQRQLDNERNKNESLEKQVQKLQKQLLERGGSSQRSGFFGASKKDPTKELQDKVDTLEQQNAELQSKLKKERREQEQILHKKDLELKELNESLEQFMEADRGTSTLAGTTDLKLRNEVAQLKAQLRVAEGKQEKLQEEMEHKDLELKTLKQNKRSSLETITSADQDVTRLVKENDDLQEKLKFKDETIDHLMDQLKTLKLAGSKDIKERLNANNPSTEDAGLSGLWNRMSPGALRNRKTAAGDRNTRNSISAPKL